LRQLIPQGGRHFIRKASSKTRCRNEIELIPLRIIEKSVL